MRIDRLAMQRARPRYEQAQQEQRMERRARLDRLSVTEPRLDQIDRELRMGGASLARAALITSPERAEQLIGQMAQKNQSLQAERAALLEKMGYPADYLNSGILCGKCEDTGYLPDGKLCQCLATFYRQEQRALLKEAAGNHNLLFNDFSRRIFVNDYRRTSDAPSRLRAEQYDRCQRFADELRVRRGNLLLEGISGCGKTTLAMCIAYSAIDNGLSVAYASALDYVTQCDNERFRRDEEAAAFLERCGQVDLLILDDLGSEPSGSHNNAYFLSLLQQREHSGGSTVICTLNAAGKGGLFERMSQPVSSRLRGDFERISIQGDDLRGSRQAF